MKTLNTICKLRVKTANHLKQCLSNIVPPKLVRISKIGDNNNLHSKCLPKLQDGEAFKCTRILGTQWSKFLLTNAKMKFSEI